MSASASLPLSALPPWLAQLHQVVRVYEAGDSFILRCRWCAGAGWTLPRVYLRETHLVGVLLICDHGIQHAVDGDLGLDGHGEPLDEFNEEVLRWAN